MPRQRKDRIDDNQQQIVKDLRKLGYSVITGMDDLLIGHNGRNYWIELKRPESRSKRTGEILPSFIKEGQKELLATYRGQYAIVTSLDEILELIKGK